MKLNLGGGQQVIPGYINVDFREGDVVADLEEGLPFADRSIDVINSCHLFEHINNFIELMDECWRVLKDDGFMMAAVPAFPNEAAVASPAHVRFFTSKTFPLFVDIWPNVGFDRKPWALEMDIRAPCTFLEERDGEQIFILMRPDRREDVQASPDSDRQP